MPHFKLSLVFSSFISICLLLFSCNADESVKVKAANNQFTTQVQTITPSQTEALEDTLLSDSLNISLRLELASLYYSEEKLEEALFQFLKVTDIDNKNLTALINVGNIYYDSQQFEKAIDYYKKALIIDNKNVNVKCDMATCYLNNKMPEKAIEILKENVKTNFNHVQSHYNLAVIYKQLGKIKESDDEMKIFNSISPN